MPRIAILAAAAVLLLLILVQLALPPLAERQVEKRLTERGGTADVDLSALPAPRLLFKEGDSIRVRAHGIAVPLTGLGSREALKDLDGFDSVDVRATEVKVGPFTIALLSLARKTGEGTYTARITATVTGADLSKFAGRTLGGGLGGFLSGLATSAMPGADTEIPIDLKAVLRSDEGRARAVDVQGNVAGFPAGPLVEAVIAALAGRF
jgi:hypothetical protein